MPVVNGKHFGYGTKGKKAAKKYAKKTGKKVKHKKNPGYYVENTLGDSLWNTYRSMAYLIEAYNRAGRIRAVAKERAQRAEKHRKRTGQTPRSTSRLNPEGKPQSGERRELHQYKRYSTNPPTP